MTLPNYGGKVNTLLLCTNQLKFNKCTHSLTNKNGYKTLGTNLIHSLLRLLSLAYFNYRLTNRPTVQHTHLIELLCCQKYTKILAITLFINRSHVNVEFFTFSSFFWFQQSSYSIHFFCVYITLVPKVLYPPYPIRWHNNFEYFH